MRTMRPTLSSILLLSVAAVPLAAQRNVSPPGPAVQASAKKTAEPVTVMPVPSLYVAPKTDKKPLNIADYAKWRGVGSVAISDDGNWATYSYTQRNVDDTLFLKNLTTGATTTLPRASGPVFTDDSKFVAYIVAPPGAGGGRGAGRGAAGGGRGGAGGGGGGGRGGRGGQPGAQADTAATPAVRHLELRSLATNTIVKTWDNPQSFNFNKGTTALLIHKPRATADAGAAPAAAPAGGGGRGGRGGGGGGAPSTVGTDLIVHHMKDGTDELIGSVSASEFNRAGNMLAYTIASPDRDGNGVWVLSADNWSRRNLDNVRADYTRLTWDTSGTAVAVLRGTDKRGFTEKENAIVAFTALDQAEFATTVIGPTGVPGLSDKMVISERGNISWSPDRSKIFVQLREQEPTQAPRDTSAGDGVPVGNVDIFHWKDDAIQTVQMVRAAQDRNRTLAAVALVAQKKIVQLADDRISNVQVTRDGNWAMGGDNKDYQDDWKPNYNDYYRINTSTGERTPVLKQQERALGFSPDGKYWLYWKDKNVFAYNIAANTHTNITKGAPVSFVNEEEDHVGEKPAYGVTGYSKDGKYVILDHKFDLYAVPLDGSGAVKNLTQGLGAKNQIRFRYERIDAEVDPTAPAPGGGGGRGGGGGGAVIDLTKPISFSAFGETDKKDGFYELKDDQMVKVLYDDKSFGRAIKAKNADRVLITKESWVDFPDYYVTDSKFTKWDRLTNANPQQSEYLWGKRILIDYKDKDGHKLQGTLVIPDTYQPGQKLPMLVDYYEKYSQNLNKYSVPRYATAPQFVDYVSNGYLVMQPDVYYHTGRSHTDMLNSVEAAVRRVIELGYADPMRIGLHGHSYSGQGSAYISTQSKLFNAVVAGAAATDLVADFNQLWKTSGTNQHRYDIYGQGRFGTNPFDNLQLFMDQSALFNAKTMDTHLLMLQGTNDGSVEWLQGVEFYNALRFLGKSIIYLSYEGEAHGFTRYDNQYDVMVRMHQYYDHYLKGEPAADWIENGLPFLKKKAPTGAAAQPVTLMGGGAGVGTPGTAGGAAGGGGRGGGGQ